MVEPARADAVSFAPLLDGDAAGRPKRALVTGAASGIGAAIAAALRVAGWSVVGLDRNAVPPAAAPASVDTNGLAAAGRDVLGCAAEAAAVHHAPVGATGASAAHHVQEGVTGASAAHHVQEGVTGASAVHHVQVDLTDDIALRAALHGVGPVDAVVHAAGFMRTAPLGHLNPDDGEAMWRIHVRAAEVLIDALAPTLPDGARVVLVGSRTANGAAGRSQYAATKAALIGMARSWAAELAPRGITVNVIAPGATDTPMLRDPARGGTPPRLPPMGRFVRPDEIGAVAAFLLGPGAGAITGQQIVVCGGASL